MESDHNSNIDHVWQVKEDLADLGFLDPGADLKELKRGTKYSRILLILSWVFLTLSSWQVGTSSMDGWGAQYRPKSLSWCRGAHSSHFYIFWFFSVLALRCQRLTERCTVRSWLPTPWWWTYTSRGPTTTSLEGLDRFLCQFFLTLSEYVKGCKLHFVWWVRDILNWSKITLFVRIPGATGRQRHKPKVMPSPACQSWFLGWTLVVTWKSQ